MPEKKARKKNNPKAEPMPGIIFASLDNMSELPKETPPVVNNTPLSYNVRAQLAQRWLWIGVTTFLALILLVLTSSWYTRFTNITWQQSAEYNLWQNTRTNWNEIFATQKPQSIERQLIRQQLKDALDRALANYPTTTSPIATSTTSSTEHFVTSTTSTAPLTK